jgi:TolB-like protein
MSPFHKFSSRRAARSAARWFVELDRESAATRDESKFAAWLARDSRNEAAFARCQAVVSLTAKSLSRPRVDWAFEEAAQLAHARPLVPRASPWYGRPAFAWSIAALSMLVAALAVLDRSVPARSSAPWSAPAAEPGLGGNVAVGDGARDPALVLPGDIVVDAGSVVVLPFGSTAQEPSEPAGEATIETVAARLYDGVLRQLNALPGVYVVDREAAAAYAGRAIDADEIARQLGARGIVEAQVTSDGGQVRVEFRFIDAARNSTLQKAFERPADELTVMRSDIVTDIAGALADSPKSSVLAPPLANEGDLP